ncbi:MAG TPA: N-acetylmuramoyl-L-alanine amidase [Longimicrobiaceae bacterium]|nr:N-acetylmuramoyl-L-alanine amidase [Longimicrobiaceae bacterium]
MHARLSAVVSLALLALLGGCGGPAAGPGSAPAPVQGETPRGLPPIPRVTGPLAVDVVYPRENAALPVRDSTFIFGNVGTGDARLTINGVPVQVHPNGAFLAFLPVPEDGVYRAVATRGTETTRAERRVRVPPAERASASGRPVMVAGSIAPRGGWAVLPGERVEVSFRGTAGGRATLVLPDGRRIALVEERRGERSGREFVVAPEPGAQAPSGISTYRGFLEAQTLAVRDTSVARPRLSVGTPETRREDLAAAAAAGAATIEIVVGGDTVRSLLPLNLTVVSTERPRVGVANDPRPVGGTNDGYVVGRPAPGTTSNWFWPNGTELLITGERAGEYRVQLQPGLSAWVSADEVRVLPPGTPLPATLVGSVRMHPDTGWVDVRFSLGRRIPFEVQVDGSVLDVILYGATSATDWLFLGPLDPLIERADWRQEADGVYRLRVFLTRPVWGYETSWTDNGNLVLRVRRPPRIDPAQPLRGLLVALDPGHGPPEGRWGPTRFTESAANLGITERLARLLEGAGARVLLTRRDTSAVGLYDRPLMARRAGAHLFVSVHNNALPDGVNPYENNGMSVYYFHPHSAALAREIQRGLVSEFTLRDLGYGRSSLAVVRWPTWFPAALSESMFFMIPEQEAALRSPEGQERIARAHLRGIEAFLRERA